MPGSRFSRQDRRSTQEGQQSQAGSPSQAAPQSQASPPSKAAMEASIEGHTASGDYVKTIQLRSAAGATASVITLGARVVDLRLSDGLQLVLPFSTLDAVEADPMNVNVAVGQIANRVKDGRILRHPEIDAEAHLQKNENGINHIHGGVTGWAQRLFTATKLSESSVQMSYFSEDQDQGYPSSVQVTVKFELSGDAKLDVTLTTANVGHMPTITNMTLHPYFDLTGNGGTIENSALSYEMEAPTCGRYLVLDSANTPTGEIASVEGTRFDFREKRLIDDGSEPKGYDQYWVADEYGDGSVKSLASVTGTPSINGYKVNLEVLSVEPGFQMYTANHMDGSSEGKFARFGSVAIEPSGLIDAGNHDNFPTIALAPGETKNQAMTYSFTVLN